ncbi:pentapeptide repeats [Caudoviricetes sp.]|nr:pentapeptide repeats [Caudoviricetes sp.]
MNDLVEKIKSKNLRYANLSYADLISADLSYANLSYTDLKGAMLSNCIGNGNEIKTLIIDKWIITYTTDQMAIGCKQHSLKQWMAIDDAEIYKIGDGALEFWHKYKPILQALFIAQKIKFD